MIEVKIEIKYEGKTKKYPSGGRIGTSTILVNPPLESVTETCGKLHKEVLDELLNPDDAAGINWTISWSTQ